MKKKTCTKCGNSKQIDQFYAHTQGKRPKLVSAACKTCEAERMKLYYAGHKAEKKLWSAARYIRLKDAVFSAYGGYRCKCCGETEPLFLGIDHIDNNGSEHRKDIFKGTVKGALKGDYRMATGIFTYRWLEKNGFPPGYQVLCANCNHGKHRNGGICPHKRSEGSTTRAKARTAKRREVRSPS